MDQDPAPWTVPQAPRLAAGFEPTPAEALAPFWELPVAMMSVVDFDGFVVAANPAHEQVLGWSPLDMVGRSYWDFAHPDDRDRVVDDGAVPFDGGTLTAYRLRMLCREGGWRETVWNVVGDPERQLVYAVGLPLGDQGPGNSVAGGN
jgi:PAS domain S-box-containing protein